MHFILVLVMLLVVGVYVFIKLRNSKVIDKLTHELLDDEEKKPDVVIKDISEAEKALQEKAAEDIKVAKQLEQESAEIGDYLASKGVVKADETKEGDQSKE